MNVGACRNMSEYGSGQFLVRLPPRSTLHMEYQNENDKYAHPSRNDLGSDEAAIRYGVDLAQEQRHVIDDATARRIAMQYHGGQRSALYSFGSCGAIQLEALSGELWRGYLETPEPEHRELIEELARYVVAEGERDAVYEWHDLTADDAPVCLNFVRGDDGRPPRVEDFDFWEALLSDNSEG